MNPQHIPDVVRKSLSLHKFLSISQSWRGMWFYKEQCLKGERILTEIWGSSDFLRIISLNIWVMVKEYIYYWCFFPVTMVIVGFLPVTNPWVVKTVIQLQCVPVSSGPFPKCLEAFYNWQILYKSNITLLFASPAGLRYLNVDLGADLGFWEVEKGAAFPCRCWSKRAKTALSGSAAGTGSWRSWKGTGKPRTQRMKGSVSALLFRSLFSDKAAPGAAASK